MAYWAVAMTKSASEHIAQYNLTRQNFETYLPKYLSGVGKEIKVKVLFPRYIFIRIDLQWHKINGTRGVTRIIMNDLKPAQIPDKVIQNLKACEDVKGLITLPEQPKFVPGQPVRVVKGPFLDYIAVYDGMRPNERVRALIKMLGQTVPIELDQEDLVAVAIGSKEGEVEL